MLCCLASAQVPRATKANVGEGKARNEVPKMESKLVANGFVHPPNPNQIPIPIKDTTSKHRLVGLAVAAAMASQSAIIVFPPNASSPSSLLAIHRYKVIET
ncbi:hypothetical protein ACFX15_034598 [Malus domestica]